MAFREGLLHVVENLLDNAIKYSPAKGQMRVYSEGTEDGWTFSFVEDQGPGIPKEAQTRVFERFFRVDVSRSREAGGTGLGLSIVKHLVRKHGGRGDTQERVWERKCFYGVLINGPGLTVPRVFLDVFIYLN